MKIVINKENLVIATHSNDQDVQELYDNENLEIVRVPDNIIIYDPVSNEDQFEAASLPIDPRISWSLEEAKINAQNVLPDIAEECRVKILSSMPGKIASYRVKEEVARRTLLSEKPQKSDISFLQLEADNRGVTTVELANLIISKADHFKKISSFIDGELQRVQKSILACDSYKVIWQELENFEKAILAKIAI